MGNKVVYFKGIRLWENAKHWKPQPTRGGSSRKLGTSRKRGKLNPMSGNFFYEIAVHTDVKPVTALSGLGRQETFNLQMLQMVKVLIEASDSLGDLSWCQDDTEYVTIDAVTNPGSYPGAGTCTFTGSGFTPAVGDKVLFRNPTTGAGFCTEVTSASAGNCGAVFSQAVAIGWEIVLVRYYFPDINFVSVAPWDTAVQAEDNHSFDVSYLFEGESHYVCKTAYIQDLS